MQGAIQVLWFTFAFYLLLQLLSVFSMSLLYFRVTDWRWFVRRCWGAPYKFSWWRWWWWSRGWRLSELGAAKLVARRDVDSEDRQPIESWFDDVSTSLQSTDVDTQLDYLSAIISDVDDEDESASGPSRERPYFATLAVRWELPYVWMSRYTKRQFLTNLHQIWCADNIWVTSGP